MANEVEIRIAILRCNAFNDRIFFFWRKGLTMISRTLYDDNDANETSATNRRHARTHSSSLLRTEFRWFERSNQKKNQHKELLTYAHEFIRFVCVLCLVVHFFCG